MTKSFTLNNTSDSILSRICLVSLIWLLLVLGGFSSRVWGEDVTTENVYSPSYVKRTVATDNGSSSLSISKASVVDGNYVCALTNGITFTMDAKDGSGNDVSFTGKNGYMEFSCSRGAHRYVYLSWTIPSNHNLKVTKISIKARNDATLRTSRCVIDGTASGEVGTLINDSKDQLVEGATKAGGYSNNVVIDFYRSSGGIGDGTNYIAAIYITYELSYNANIFGFEAEAESNNESYGTATAVLSIAPKDTLQGGPGVTSKSTSATYTATPKSGCQFLGWYSDDEYEDFVIATNPYSPTLTNSTAGSTLTRTLYALFTNKLNKSITWSQSISNSVRSTVIDLTATATGGQDVYYTASPEGRVSINNTTKKLTCLTAGEVTITAHSDENATYFASSNNPTKTFIVLEHAITTNPTASGTLTYEQTLNTISLTGGVANVAGTWAWKYPSSVPGAGTANQVAVFTPSSSVISAYPLECNVSVTVNKANPDVTCTVNANTHYVDDAKIDLQSTWTREGDGTITYSVLSFEESGENNEDGTTPYVESNRYLHLQKAGTAQVKMAIAEGTNYIARNETINVVINKRTPVYTWDGDVETKYTFEYPFNSTHREIFSTSSGEEVEYTAVSDSIYTALMIGDTLFVYNVDEIAHITISQPETYKWNSHEKTYTIKPVKTTRHVPFTMNNTSVRDSLFVGVSSDGTISCDNNGKIVLTQGGAAWTCNELYYIIHFDGIPDSVSFTYRTTQSIATSYGRGDAFVVYESETGEADSWNEIWRAEVPGDENDHNVAPQALSPTTRYLKFYFHATYTGNFKNIHVGEKLLFESDPKDLLDFGLQGQNYGKQEKTFNFNHVNAGRVTNVIITGTDKDYFTVVPTAINGTGRDISGSTTLRVSFDNKETARAEDVPYLAKIEITDNQGNRDTLNLSGRRHGKSFPQFTFNPNHVPYYFGNTIHNVVASTNTETDIDITSSDNSIAELVDGKLVIKDKGSEVTITVHQAAIGDFREHTETFKFTPRAMPPLSVPFMMADSICNNAAMVTKGSKCGWQDDDCIRVGEFQAAVYWNDEKRFVIEFGGTPDKLTFELKNWAPAIVERWKVEESPDGSEDTYTVAWSISKAYDGSEWTPISAIQLKPTTHFVRFSYGGNYMGYFNNINITALDGIKYMLAPNGLYLSRGKAYGTQAVLDEFGVPVRVTRYTSDNVKANELMQVQFMDNRQYLYETSSGDVYTDNETSSESSRKLWNQIVSEGKVKVKSANGSNKYITITADSVLTTTSDAATATAWTIEDYTLHADRIQTKLDHKAAAAAEHDFGSEINTMAKVRTMLDTEEFDYTNIDIEAVSPAEQKGVYRYEYPDSRGTFSVYDHVITSLEPGFYRLEVQALYKPSPSPVDWENHNNGYESVVGYVYANDFQYPIKSVYDETGRRAVTYGAGKNDTLCGGYYYPADLAAATDAFTDPETYKHDLYVYIPADEGKTTGTLRYGIKNPSYVPGVWMAYSNFKLEKIARKIYIFDGNGGSSTVWNVNTNWEYQGETPIAPPGEKNAVVIRSDVEVAGEFKVYSLAIENNAKVTIAPEGGLSIGVGGVKGGTVNNIKLSARRTGANKGQTGYLRISPECPEDIEMPNATIELYSIGYWDKVGGGNAQWQFVGAPISDAGVKAKTVYKDSYVYSWSESANDWVNNRFKMTFEPFVGFEVTQTVASSGLLSEYAGRLVSGNEVITKNLVYTDGDHGYNAMANSFAAPMAITGFNSTDFVNTEYTIYILNAGSKAQSLSSAESENYSDAGKFYAIPLGSAETMASTYGTPLTIPSMQGFFVKATGESAQLKIDYSRLVWGVDYSGSVVNQPLRAPKRSAAEKSKIGSLQVSVYANGEIDHLYMLESEERLPEFENGYDAHKMMNDGMNIFAVEGEDEFMSVNATNSISGTRVGVRTGEETAYTLLFSHVDSEDELALYDSETEQTIDINEGTQYTFFAESSAMITERFEIVARADAPAITTGVDKVENGAKVHKFIKGNQLFILKNGVLYNATGAVVR